MQQVIRVNKLTERAKELEVLKQREYFEAQKRANLYLLKKVGNVYFAGKPYRVGKILEIPVYYDFGASGKKQVGTFSTDLETYELIPSKSDSPENIWGNTDAASKEATPFLIPNLDQPATNTKKVSTITDPRKRVSSL